MADIIASGGLPAGTQFKYRDMGDGTHALVVELLSTASCGNDIVPSGGVPAGTQFRYAEQLDGTYALTWARG